MKPTIKEYLIAIVAIITIIFTICACILPTLHINNVLFALLYLVTLYPLILIGFYKIVFILIDKIIKL